MEVVIVKIQQSQELQGINFSVEQKKVTLKVIGFVDDLVVVLKRIKQLTQLVNLLKNFGRHSGLIMQPKKTRGIWLANQAKSEAILGI